MTGWFRRLVLVCLGVTGAVVLNIAGCPPPTFEELVPGVTLKQVADIQNDTTLDQAGKEKALNDLGITDKQLIQALLNSPIPSAT
jgi:hypothetical protein